MKKLVCCIIFTISSFIALAQNPRTSYPQAINLYAMGPNAVGSISYDHFLNPNINLEGGIGYIGIHAGVRYHFLGEDANRRLTPYTGVSAARPIFPNVGLDFLPYVPLGIHYIGPENFNFAIEVAPLQFRFQSWNIAGVKLGFRF